MRRHFFPNTHIPAPPWRSLARRPRRSRRWIGSHLLSGVRTLRTPQRSRFG